MVVGEGDDQLLEVDVVTLQGAIVVCYGGGRKVDDFGAVDVVPLLGAGVLWLGGRGGDQAEWTGCDCWVAEPASTCLPLRNACRQASFRANR